MTIIASIVKDGKTWMGADSAVTTYLDHSRSKVDSKIFHKHGFLFGATGYVFETQAVLYRLELSKWREDEQDFMEFCALELMPSMRKAMEKHGAIKCKESRWEMENQWIIAAPGGNVVVLNGGSLVRYESDFVAVGSGMDAAEGSLHTSAQLKVGTEKRLKLAIQAANDLNNFCGGRIDVETI